MPCHKDFKTSAQFHESYLSEMLLEKNIRYTKKNPNGVTEEYYLLELIDRQEESGHLNSFKKFVEFCNAVKKAIKEDYK